MTTNYNNNVDLDNLKQKIKEINVLEVIPNSSRNKISNEDISKIIKTISETLSIEPELVFLGIMYLFLQGAASAGTPLSLSVDLGNGKCLEKKNIINACNLVCNHGFIRRIAEALASDIGQFAYENNYKGEIANRINNRCKTESGSGLTDIEMAYCSSFSQSITNLNEITGSPKLARLLAEDYAKRFESKTNNKNKNPNNEKNNNNRSKNNNNKR